MDNQHKVYINQKWAQFAARVKQRDGFQCLQCGRSGPGIVLQVHHTVYIEGKAPWDYPLSDCLTLCKGCHAREHDLIEPNRDWTLLSIDDLGGLDGICQRPGCGHEIRYAHLTYHPKAGYRIVGSTCIQRLTEKDRLLSNAFVKAYQQISHYLHQTDWVAGHTQKGVRYLAGQYKHHRMRIYGTENRYSFQLVLKEKGIRWHEYKSVVNLPGKSLTSVKEMAYVALKGTVSEDAEEKALLRQVYRQLGSCAA